MVEMLGILPIIGVLSVGGIAGYTMAMNRYRANEVVDMANKYAVIAYSAYMTAKMMNNGSTTAANAAVPSFAETGLFGQSSKVNGTSFDVKSITEGGVTMELIFPSDGKKICQATATSLGIKPDSTSTIKVPDPNDPTKKIDQEVSAGCNSDQKLTYVFKQS